MQINRYYSDEVCDWHCDDDIHAITLTIGETRKLKFRNKDSKNEIGSVDLGNGDLFAFNSHHGRLYEHGIDIEPERTSVRYLLLFFYTLWPMEDPCKTMKLVPQNFIPVKEYKLLSYERDAPPTETEVGVICFDKNGEKIDKPYFIHDGVSSDTNGLWLSSYEEAQKRLNLPSEL